MAKNEAPRSRIRVNGQVVHVPPSSSLDASIIKLMVDHQAALAERFGEEYHLRGGYPAHLVHNTSLAAALRAKGLIHTARAKSSNALGDIAKDGEAPGDSLPDAATTAA